VKKITSISNAQQGKVCSLTENEGDKNRLYQRGEREQGGERTYAVRVGRETGE